MKNLIFVGAGGLFLELFDYMCADSAVHGKVAFKGIIDNIKRQDELPLTLLCQDISEYILDVDDVFLITLGDAVHRKKLFDKLKRKGATLYTYVHPSALVAASAIVGEGSIVAPYSIVNACAELSDNVLINVHCSVGHHSVIGYHSVLSPYSAVNGYATMGEQCFLGTRATVFPKVTIGNKCIVDSHSYVKSPTPDKSIVSVRGEYIVVNNRLMR